MNLDNNLNLDSRVKSFYLVAFTSSGHQIVERLATHLSPTYAVAIYQKSVHESLQGFVKELFIENNESSCLIVVGATGIAIRLIAPYVKDKLTDPAVIVIDDMGQFVISLLSGHLGGANSLTQHLSQVLMTHNYPAVPVITTATDNRGLEGIETVLRSYMIPLQPIRGAIKRINQHIAEGGSICLAVDPLLGRHHVDSDILRPCRNREDGSLLVAICLRDPKVWVESSSFPYFDYVFTSKSLVLGTGCKKNLSSDHYLSTLKRLLENQQFLPESIHTISSIALKENEPCIHEASHTYDTDLVFHETDQLKSVAALFEPSNFVISQIGIGAVAGPCAYEITKDTNTLTVIKQMGCTFSIGRLLR